MEGLEFNNAIEIGDKPVTESGELDISKLGFPVETLEEPTEVIESTETKETEEVIEVSDSVQTEEPTDTGYLEYIPSVANFLSERGLIKEVPQGIDLEAFDEDAFVKTMEHNMELEKYAAWEQGVKEEQERIVGKLSPLAQKMLSYNLQNPNADDKEISSYLQSITENDFIQELDVESHSDKIVRDYYKKVVGWSAKEVEDKVATLVASDTLKKEAELLKPKLSAHVGNIVKQKTEQAALIAEQTRLVNEQLGGKVNDLLRTGKINGIPLTRDEGSFIQTALLNNEVPVNLKGKKVEMGYAEALVLQQKYQGNLENLALGLLIIKNGPEAVEKFISKQARTKETEKFIKQNKFSNTKKKSVSVDKNEMYNTGGLNFNL